MPNEVMYMVKETDLNELKGLVQDLSGEVAELKKNRAAITNGADILNAKYVMEDLGISRTSLDRRMFDWDNPIPMVREGNRLKIRRDKYDAWKQAHGL